MSNRVLIFVVAYNAGNHIRSVVDRLPKEVFNHPRYHVLIIDDCSKDETAKTASHHVANFNYTNVTVLRNTINMGYGGNQKIGYRYAVENGFGFVILLHGDGQYAPELVLEFVKKWENEGSEIILGSRMLEKSRARAGGMPFYKWIGNQVLTRYQNWMIGSKLSEFHTGYRAYDTRFLNRVPFELNTNEFHFDTEILLQGYACNAKFSEFSIPTHYGDEICHVNGMKYAFDVFKACLKYRFQRIGFFCSMPYKGLFPLDESKRGTAQFHVLEHLQKAKNVLFVGSKSAFVESKLKENNIQTDYTDVYLGSQTKDVSEYDTVLVLDVLEKLTDTERFLVSCRYSMKTLKQPRFLFSSGNVSFIGVRLLLGFGMFTYGDRGILKDSNKRLFTTSSLHSTLEECGFEVGEIRGIGVPFHWVFSGFIGRSLASVSDSLARIWPSMFAYNFLIEAKPKPHSYMLLSKAEKFYGENQKTI